MLSLNDETTFLKSKFMRHDKLYVFFNSDMTDGNMF